jgi:hypothetical protein
VKEGPGDRQATAVDFLEIIPIRQAVAEKKLALIIESRGKNISIYLIFNILLFKGD